jgi:uncharacterized membrane protein
VFAVATALVFLDEPLVAGLVAGAVLIVTGGVLLASDRATPDHFKRIGLLYALVGTAAFATRDTVVRWLATDVSDVDPRLAAFAAMLTGTTVALAFALLLGAPLSRRAARAFLPAGLCYGLSYVFLFEAFFRGRVSVVSPMVATESLWGVTLSWIVLRKSENVGVRLFVGAALVVAGGVLIGIYPLLDPRQCVAQLLVALDLAAHAALLVGDEPGGDDRRDERNRCHAHEHHDAADEAAAAGRRDDVAVADGRDRLRSPPHLVSEGRECLRAQEVDGESGHHHGHEHHQHQVGDDPARDDSAVQPGHALVAYQPHPCSLLSAAAVSSRHDLLR